MSRYLALPSRRSAALYSEVVDKDRARAVLIERLAAYRAEPYVALRGLIGSLDVYEVANLDGTAYQIEVLVMWDDRPGGDIRVMGSIDDGGWSAFVPLTESFILSAGGTFAGE